MTREGPFDICLIGAGIVGLATAYALIRMDPALRLLVLEKEVSVARHQTGHNSGVLHTGVYYRPGSNKARFCREGREKMVEFCSSEELPLHICGKVIVATAEEELPRLQRLERLAHENGVRTTPLSAAELLEREPHAAGLGALFIPDAGVVDFSRVAERLWLRASDAGVAFAFEAEVVELSRTGREVQVSTTTESYRTRFVVNCGGLQSDRLARLGGASPDVQIVPFRGEYYELVPEARDLVRHLIYPVPDPELPFLGVHFTRGVHGSVECGPSAFVNGGREAYDKFSWEPSDWAETILFPGFWSLARRYPTATVSELRRFLSKAAFLESARRLVPRLEARHLTPGPAGIRAQAVRRDGKLLDDFEFAESEFVLSVINAPSPAATASLRLGEIIAERVLRRL